MAVKVSPILFPLEYVQYILSLQFFDFDAFADQPDSSSFNSWHDMLSLSTGVIHCFPDFLLGLVLVFRFSSSSLTSFFFIFGCHYAIICFINFFNFTRLRIILLAFLGYLFPVFCGVDYRLLSWPSSRVNFNEFVV